MGKLRNEIFLLVLTCSLSHAASARTLAPTQASLETNVIPVFSLATDSDQVFYTVPRRSAIVLTPYKGFNTLPDKAFGSFAESRKFLVQDKKKNFLAHFGLVMDEQIVIFDGISLNAALYSPKDQRVWRFGDIIYDRIKPHADRGGEAPRAEVRDLRTRFTEQMRVPNELKLSHGRLVPEPLRADRNKDTFELLVTTRLSSASLITLHCQNDSRVNCIVKRRCPIDLKDIDGVAIWAKKKWLLAGKAREIRVYNFDSCNAIRYRHKISLPTALPPIADLAVDSEGTLWVATQKRDQISHGSIFLWPESKWN